MIDLSSRGHNWIRGTVLDPPKLITTTIGTVSHQSTVIKGLLVQKIYQSASVAEGASPKAD